MRVTGESRMEEERKEWKQRQMYRSIKTIKKGENDRAGQSRINKQLFFVISSEAFILLRIKKNMFVCVYGRGICL